MGEEMKKPGLMETKMEERLNWATEMVKRLCKKENIEFDKDFLLRAIEVGKTLLVRSEIAYSGRQG